MSFQGALPLADVSLPDPLGRLFSLIAEIRTLSAVPVHQLLPDIDVEPFQAGDGLGMLSFPVGHLFLGHLAPLALAGLLDPLAIAPSLHQLDFPGVFPVEFGQLVGLATSEAGGSPGIILPMVSMALALMDHESLPFSPVSIANPAATSTTSAGGGIGGSGGELAFGIMIRVPRAKRFGQRPLECRQFDLDLVERPVHVASASSARKVSSRCHKAR